MPEICEKEATNKWIKYTKPLLLLLLLLITTPSCSHFDQKQTQTLMTTSTLTSTTTTQRQHLLTGILLLLMLPHANAAAAAASSAASASSASSISSSAVVAGSRRPIDDPFASVASLSLETESEQTETNSLLLQHQRVPSMETSMNMIQRNYMIMHPVGQNDDHSRSLKRAPLTNSSIVCNDGTHAGYYLRKHPNSKKWIVFLEGGWHCFDVRSCRARWMRLRHLMTSSQWPETRDVGGILSPHPEENPYWHNANHVLIPYCSSDSWSGTRTEPDKRDRENSWRFMGALILRQVIADLIPVGLGRVPGGELLLVGSSAGGLGVMLNLDRIRDFLVNERKLQVTVRGVSDSGWFLDREPYTPAAVASSEAVRQGWKLWQGLLPEDCTKAHPTEPWRCYFGYRLYPTLKTPLFVFQWLFDEAQMRADNVGAPVTPQQWNYIHDMGGALRSSLDNVTAVFAPSCIGHAVLSKRDWVNIKIDDISLPSALRCWEHSTRRKRHDKLKRSTEATTSLQQQQHRVQHREQKLHNMQHANNQRHQRHRQRAQKHNNVATSSSSSSLSSSSPRKHNHLTKEEREERKRLRQEQRQRRRRKQRQQRRRQHQKHENEAQSGGGGAGNGGHKAKLSLSKEQRKQRRRQQQQKQGNGHPEATENGQKRRLSNNASSASASSTSTLSSSSGSMGPSSKKRQRVPRVPEKCALRLLERCSWPQCNHSCPTLTNPLTGEEMRFLELLTSFGLDIEAVAAALGVDMHTLNNMERTELVNLLTQQVS
ncbi:palmitoleoyl-protein carboxylesterase NOTUM [Drosophila tropicalis]|uniref:palmitoleoyl-protein carboxylesterase NOTUM n=1 Tax=Drosophila tropicalis TaxID=46794 RepID=UPI0035ABF77D